MKDQIARLNAGIKEMQRIIPLFSNSELSHKTAPDRWSKKEILGHLIDSAMNNLRRFNEIQFMSTPYIVQKYEQDALVKTNRYQEKDIQDLLDLWSSLNRQVEHIMAHQDEASLAAPISVDGTAFSFEWLLTSYVDHLEHHLRQIKQDAVNSTLSIPYHLTPIQAEQALQAKAPAEFITLLTSGSLEVELYIPDGVDKQSPHEKDELYVVISGSGTFVREEETYTFGPHDVLFVPAGQEHRFINFTSDFKTWVIFYGPKGGE